MADRLFEFFGYEHPPNKVQWAHFNMPTRRQWWIRVLLGHLLTLATWSALVLVGVLTYEYPEVMGWLFAIIVLLVTLGGCYWGVWFLWNDMLSDHLTSWLDKWRWKKSK